MIKVAVGIIVKKGLVLLCQRKRTALYPLKWEFPGGKLKEGETAEDCLRRELFEELGIKATVGPLFHRQSFVYPDSGTFDVFFYVISTFTGRPVNNAYEIYRWVPLDEVHLYDILEGNKDVVLKLASSYDRFSTFNS